MSDSVPDDEAPFTRIVPNARYDPVPPDPQAARLTPPGLAEARIAALEIKNRDLEQALSLARERIAELEATY